MNKTKALRFRLEKWFWVANIPLVLWLVLFRKPLWEQIGIPYVAGLSIYALVLTLSGAEQAAEANAKSDS